MTTLITCYVKTISWLCIVYMSLIRVLVWLAFWALEFGKGKVLFPSGAKAVQTNDCHMSRPSAGDVKLMWATGGRLCWRPSSQSNHPMDHATARILLRSLPSCGRRFSIQDFQSPQSSGVRYALVYSLWVSGRIKREIRRAVWGRRSTQDGTAGILKSKRLTLLIWG